MRPFEAGAIQFGGGFLSVLISFLIRAIRDSIEGSPEGSEKESQLTPIIDSFLSGVLVFGAFATALIGLDSGIYPFSPLYIVVLILLNSLINFDALNIIGILYLDCLLFGIVSTFLGTLGAVGIYKINLYLSLPNFLTFLIGALLLSIFIRGLIFLIRGV